MQLTFKNVSRLVMAEGERSLIAPIRATGVAAGAALEAAGLLSAKTRRFVRGLAVSFCVYDDGRALFVNILSKAVNLST